MEKRTRLSNFELLRIIAMLMIIGTHCISSSHAFEQFVNRSTSYIILTVLQTLCNLGVNLFVLITGYFMVERTKVSMRKPIELLLDVAIYGSALYCVSVLLGLQPFGLSGMVKSVVPLLAGYRWFVKAYIVLYLLIPYINFVVSKLSKRQYVIFLTVLFLLLSVWPTFLPSPPIDDYGYGFVHLIFLYIIGSYLRRFPWEFSTAKVLWIFFISFACTEALYLFDDVSLPVFSTVQGYVGAYNSVFNILASVSLFQLLSKITFQSQWVNLFASSAFAVFLIHGDYNIMNYLFNDLLKVPQYYQFSYWPILLITSILAVYIACAIIDMLKRKLLDKPISLLFDRIKLINFSISV